MASNDFGLTPDEQEEFEFRARAEAEAAAARTSAPPQQPVDASWGARARTLLNAAAGGALTVAGLPATTVNNVTNLAKAAIGAPYTALTGRTPDALQITPDENVPGTGAWLRQKLANSGVSTSPVDPRDPVQRYGAAAAAAVPSVALGQPETVPQAALQATGAAAGGVAQQGAADAGVGPAGQALAGTIAGAAPGLAIGLPAAAARAAFGRGGDVDYATLKGIWNANAAGIDNPTLGQASGRSWPQALEAYFSRAPAAAGPFRDEMAAQANAAAGTIKGIVDNLTDRATGRAAGLAIDRGVTGSFMDRTAATRALLYKSLDSKIPADTQIDVSPYQKRIDAILAPVKGAEAQSAVIQRSTNGDFLTSLQASLQHDLKVAGLPTGAKPYTQPAQDYFTDGTNVVPAADGLKAGMQNFAGWKRVTQPETQGYIVPGDAGPHFVSESDISPSTTLPYAAVARLRTMIGDKMDADALQGNRTDGNLKALYGALSDSMSTGAAAQGQEALNAFNRANSYYSAYRNRVDTLNNVIYRKGGPEAVYDAAMAGTKAGSSQLHSIMQSLPEEAQNTVIATTLNRMGKAIPSAQNAAGDAWSFNTFLTNYNKMSPQARDELFGRVTGDYGQQLDSLVNFANQWRQSKVPYANPSGTAGTGALLGAGSAAAGSAVEAAHGNFIPAGVLLTTLGANAAGVRLISNPRFVSWLANSYRMPQSATPALIAQLAASAKDSGDAPLGQVASILQQRLARSTSGQAPVDQVAQQK